MAYTESDGLPSLVLTMTAKPFWISLLGITAGRPPHHGVQLREVVLREIRAPKVLQLEVPREGVPVYSRLERISTRESAGILLAAQDEKR